MSKNITLKYPNPILLGGDLVDGTMHLYVPSHPDPRLLPTSESSSLWPSNLSEAVYRAKVEIAETQIQGALRIVTPINLAGMVTKVVAK